VRGKDRQDRLGSEDDIRLKVWHFRRVPIFRIAEGIDYVDSKAVNAQSEIARLSFCIAKTKGLNYERWFKSKGSLTCRKLMSQGIAQNIHLTH